MKQTSKSTVVPFLSEWHGQFIAAAASGVDIAWDVVYETDREDVWHALSLVNNDACYSALVTTAQILRFSSRNDEDVDKVGLIRTCPNCRSRDIPLIVKRSCGVDVVDNVEALFDLHGVDESKQRHLAKGIFVGDVLLQVRCSLRPYAQERDAVFFSALLESWTDRMVESLAACEEHGVEDFLEALNIEAMHFKHRRARQPKPSVGLAGSVPGLFCQAINGGIVYRIEEEGCEVVLPYMSALLSYALRGEGVSCAFVDELDRLCALADGRHKSIPRCVGVEEIRALGRSIIPEGMEYGEGWAQAGWMSSLLERGVNNIVHVGVFGCLSEHVAGRGVVREIRRRYGDMNLATVEYDPGTSEVNQLNRIKLMASVARRNMAASESD